MMTRVKFFQEESQLELEREVNDFISNKRVVNVSYSIAELGYGYIHGCCVLYDE